MGNNTVNGSTPAESHMVDGVQIIENKQFAPNTMMVSSDIYERLKQAYERVKKAAEGNDTPVDGHGQ